MVWVQLKQHASLQQKGGGLDSKDLGYSLGGGEKISYGYDSGVASLAKDLRGGYAPISRTLRPQCAGRRKRRKRVGAVVAVNAEDIINFKAINL